MTEDDFSKKCVVATYTAILYASTVVFGHIGDLRTAGREMQAQWGTPRVNWVMSAGVVSACVSLLMIFIWFVAPAFGKKINLIMAFLFTAWWAAGASIAAQVTGSEVVQGFAFVASFASTLLFVNDLLALYEGRTAPAGKGAEEDQEQGPTSD